MWKGFLRKIIEAFSVCRDARPACGTFEMHVGWIGEAAEHPNLKAAIDANVPTCRSGLSLATREC
jgi:hypothetical protein